MENKQLFEVLETLGIDGDHLGFKCLYEMIEFYHVKDEKLALDIFYQILIIKLQKNKTQIERAIRFAFYQMGHKQTALYKRLFTEEPEVVNFVETINHYLEEKHPL